MCLMRLAVVDATGGAQHAIETFVEIDESTTPSQLHALVLSLPLPSASVGCRICHDGKLLDAEDDDTLLYNHPGLLEAPIIVVVGPAPQRRGFFDSLQAQPSQRSVPQQVAAVVSASAPMQGATQVTTPPRPRTSISPPPPPPPPPPPAEEGPPADAVCRICFGAAHEDGLGKLISPCMCSGSMRYVHVQCLNEWRIHSANSRSFFQCDQVCKRARGYPSDKQRLSCIICAAPLLSANAIF